MPSPTVFIAHPTCDLEHATQLAGRLKQAGVGYFLAVEAPALGQRWSYQISEMIEGADVFVALISESGERGHGPKLDDGHYFQDEVATAIALYRRTGRPRIVPVYPDGRIPGRMPYGLRIIHGLSLTDGDWDQLVRRLPIPQILDEASRSGGIRLLRLQLEHAHARDQSTLELQNRLARRLTDFEPTDDCPIGAVFAEEYRRLERTARDAVCETWTSLDTSARTFVSLRIYAPGKTQDEEARSRLKASTQQWAGYKHQAIPKIEHKWAQDSDSQRFFIVTELLGMTLREAIDRRRVTHEELVQVLRPLAEALDYIAEDAARRSAAGEAAPLLRVNPRTIWLTADGRPRLTGFNPTGLSRTEFLRLLEPDEHRYIAPEIIWRPDEPLTPGAEQFSLGMVALEVLRGCPLDLRVLTDRRRLLLELGCGRMTQACLTRVTDVDPTRRFPSCRAFVDDLEQARVLDTQEEVIRLLTSDPSMAWLASRALRPVRCAGLPASYVHRIPNADRDVLDLELEAIRISEGATRQSEERRGEQTRAPLAQWLTNLRCLIDRESDLAKRLDAVLAVLAPQRPTSGLSVLLTEEFYHLLDVLLGDDSDVSRSILAELRGGLSTAITSTPVDGLPARAIVVCDFVHLAQVCGEDPGRTEYLGWLECLGSRAPGLPSLKAWLGKAEVFQHPPTEPEEPEDRCGLRNAVATAILGLGRYAERRVDLISVLPFAVRAELEHRSDDAAQVEADLDSIDALGGHYMSDLLERVIGSPTTHPALQPRFSTLLDRARRIPWDGEEVMPGPDELGGAVIPSRPAPHEPIEYRRLESDVLELVLNAEVDWARGDLMNGLSNWIVGWLPIKPQPKTQLMSDVRCLFDFGRGAQMPLTAWLGNVIHMWEARWPSDRPEPLPLSRLRQTHTALSDIFPPVGFALDAASWEQPAAQRPAALAEFMRPLTPTGLRDVFEAAVEDELFSEPNRARLLLEDARLDYRPLEQLRDELLRLASRVEQASSEPLQQWLQRARRLTASPERRRTYELMLTRLRAQ